MVERPERREYGSTKCEVPTKDLVDVVGGIGPWQFGIFLILFVMFFYAGLHTLSYQFLFPLQDYWCSSPFPEVDSITWRNYGVPNTTGGHDRCSMYDPGNLTWTQFLQQGNNNRSVVSCKSWHFDKSVYGESLVSSLNLACGSSNMASITQSIFSLGFFLSASIGGLIADRWGRKLGVLICLVILIPGQLLGTFSRGLVSITISRFLIGFGVSGSLTVSYVTVAEVLSSKYRDIMGAAGQSGWSVAYMMLPLFAWSVKNWVHLQYILTAITSLSIVLFFVAPESPRWLLTQGRGPEARAAITKACKMNGRLTESREKEIDALVYAYCEADDKLRLQPQSGNFSDQFKTPNIRKRTLSLYFIWLTVGFVYYGLSYQSGDLGTDPYISVFLLALVELPALGFTMFALRKMGRRYSIMGELMLAGSACFFTILVPARFVWLKIAVAMVGKLGITACSVSMFVYTTEIFPTVIRSLGLGWSNNMAWLGSIAAPFVAQLQELTSPAVPMAIFGALSITSGFLTLLLPETRGRQVPDTIDEAERM